MPPQPVTGIPLFFFFLRKKSEKTAGKGIKRIE
jgi:hypothetical protein